MAYSVMVWLVSPGQHPQEEEERLRSTEGRRRAEGARSGVNIAPAIPRMVYGVYDDEQEAASALAEVSTLLKENQPLKISTHDSNATFLVPASRVYYVACGEVERPGD